MRLGNGLQGAFSNCGLDRHGQAEGIARALLDHGADLGGIAVVGAQDGEAALAEPAVLREGRANLAGADDQCGFVQIIAKQQ